MLKVSHTKPLHDATALMADEAVTQSPQSVLIGIENLLYFS